MSAETGTWAERMEGVALPNGWQVGRRVKPPQLHGGGDPPSVGQFSRIYEVHRHAERAILKAIDFSLVFEGNDVTGMLFEQSRLHFYESKVLELCRKRRMDKIVRALDVGEYRFPDGGPTALVPYIIFERADGDARRMVRLDRADEVKWALTLLHHVSVALHQLHSGGVTHQDVKLANVFDFGGRELKLGDLGRSVPRINALVQICPHIDQALAGDFSYAPPELLYDAPPQGFDRHRRGADVYMLGSVLVALFLGTNMTAQVQNRLAKGHRARGWVHGEAWGDSYAGVMEYVRTATDNVLDELARAVASLPPKLRTGICALARELCEPDPARRGDAISVRRGQGHDLERVVTRFDILRQEASVHALVMAA